MDICNLPSDIIAIILARLPLRETVRTSILSQKWRYKWRCVPNLVIDCLVDRISNLEIDQVLRDHQGPVNKFFLSCRTSPDIDKWIQLLSSSCLKDFTLHIFRGDKHGIPSHFFVFQNLKHLYLYRCIFKPQALPEKGFSKLITLDFQEVDFVPAIFEHFISQSPLLETLRLVNCTKLDAFEIQGPSLRVFTFHGVFSSISFEKSPVLAEVSLSIPIRQIRGILFPSSFTYFHIAPTLEKLHLHPCVLEFLGAASVPAPSDGSFNCLKVLNLSMYLDSIIEVNCALWLARSCPNLETLSVTLYSSSVEFEGVGQYIRDYETQKPFLDKLRRVEIALFSGSEPQIELLRYLLASTVGLEEMVISESDQSTSPGISNCHCICRDNVVACLGNPFVLLFKSYRSTVISEYIPLNTCFNPVISSLNKQPAISKFIESAQAISAASQTALYM